MVTNDLAEVKSVVKSLIIPYKEGASVNNITHDYQDIEGRRFPYAEFGYSSPRDFLNSMRDILISSCNNYGEPVYRAKISSDVAHVQAMVLGQKTAPKKKRKRPIYSGYSVYNNHQVHHHQGMRRSNVPVSWTWGCQNNRSSNVPSNPRSQPILPAGFDDPRPSTSNNNLNSNNNNNLRITRTIRPLSQNNQPGVSRVPPIQPQVNSQFKPGLQSNKRLPGPPNNARAAPPFLSADDIKRIKDLLREHQAEGINEAIFKKLYERVYGLPLEPKSRGFSDLQHALSSIPHICKVELHSSRKYYVVKPVDVSKVTNGNSNSNNTPKSPRKSPRRSPRQSPRQSPKKPGAGPSNGTADPLTNGKSPRRKVVNASDQPYGVKIEVQNDIDEALDNFPKTAIEYFEKILRTNPKGISDSDFLEAYETLARAPMEPTSWGYLAPVEIFYGLPSLFFVDPADSRPGKDNQETILYHAKQVPPDVHKRVAEYQAKNSQAPPTDSQALWELKLRIMVLLMEAADGISLDSLATDYYLNFKTSLDPSHYDFKDFQEMFESLSRDLPIQIVTNFAGDELRISLIDGWKSKWIDICVVNEQHDALKAMLKPDVVLPGDTIPEVSIDPSTINSDVWHHTFLTSVVNPHCIFINLVGKYNSEALDNLMSKLQFYRTEKANDYCLPAFCLKEGYFCVAPFDVDKCWHRVKIVKVEPEAKRVKVSFIDFGGEQIIDAVKLRLMKKEFSYLPAQAIRISTRGIQPKEERWTANAKAEVLNFMSTAMSQQDTIHCRFHHRKSTFIKDSVRFEAEICAKVPLGFIFLHKQLIESGLAIPDDVSSERKGSDFLIPNEDIHRSNRKMPRVNAGRMISTLKNLQSKKATTNGEFAINGNGIPDETLTNGQMPYTNGSDHSKYEATNLESKLDNLTI